MKDAVKRAILAASLVVLMWALPARGQLQVGDNTSMNLSGNLAFGYNGDYSNVVGSDHNLSPSGNADLSGFYYSPGFLSFDVQPFYNESRDNSTSQSIFQSGGVNANASIFSGSHFPGSVSYSKIYNSEGGLAVPGVGNFTTRGNSQNVSLGWNIRVPDYPNVSFQFTDGSNANSVFGTDANSTFHSKMAGVNVSDTLAGFSLNGGYHHSTAQAMIPEFLAGEGPQTSDTSANVFDFNVGHKLPLHGAFSATANRSDISSESSGQTFNGTIDSVGSGASFEPITNLNLGVDVQYINNLEGSLYESVVAAGTVLPSGLFNYSTHSLDYNGHATYVLPAQHLTFGAIADRREETILGTSLASDTLDETAMYAAELWGGSFSASVGLSQTILSGTTGSRTQGTFDTVSYSRRIQNWRLTGSFNYSRNTQTVLIGYTSSGRSYTAGIGRRLSSSSYWSFDAIGTKTDFNNQAGSGNLTQSYATALTLKRFSVSGGYSKASGISILTPTGLTPVTNPTPILTPLSEVVFNAKSLSFGASMNLARGLVMSGSYANTKSNTLASSAASENTTAQLNTMLQYKVRQLWIQGGYLKLQQGFSITGQPAASYSSFFVGITRWFKFF